MAVPTDISFCHLVVGVTDMDRALTFYRDALGMDVVFETLISGEPFDAALRAKSPQQGRVAGGLLGGLMIELLSPGVKDSEEADLSAEMPWIGRDLQQGLGNRTEQQTVEQSLILQGQWSELFGRRENDVAVRNRQQLFGPLRQPTIARR